MEVICKQSMIMYALHLDASEVGSLWLLQAERGSDICETWCSAAFAMPSAGSNRVGKSWLAWQHDCRAQKCWQTYHFLGQHLVQESCPFGSSAKPHRSSLTAVHCLLRKLQKSRSRK